MTMYEYYKDKYKRTSYPLMDEHQFDALIAEIRAEFTEELEKSFKELKEENSVLRAKLESFGELHKVAEFVPNTINKCRSENKPSKKEKTNLKVGEWYYCYADLTIPNAVHSCCVPTSISGNFVFDGKFLVVPNTSLIVDDDGNVTYDLNSTITYEPSIFDKIEDFNSPKKKFRRMTYKELDNWLEQGKGVIRIADVVKNTISYDCEDRNHEVSSYYKICGYDEDAWHEPLIEA